MDVFTTFFVLVFALLVIAFVYIAHAMGIFKKRVQREAREADEVAHKTFDLLAEDIQEQIKLLENARTKRELTEEEEKVVAQLKKDLFDAERFIRREIKDIEKEVE